MTLEPSLDSHAAASGATTGAEPHNTATPPTARLATVALPAVTVLGGLCASMITAVTSDVDSAFGPTTAWVVPAYFIGAGLSAVASGRIADRVGARRVVLGGLVLVIVTSLLAALAASGPWLAIARAALGASTAALFPAALLLVRRLYPTGPRQIAGLGLIALATEAAFAAGPTIGAILADFGGWRLVVAAPALVALVATVLVLFAIPSDSGTPQASRAVLRGLDLPGLALLAVVACVVLVWLQSAGTAPWYLPAAAVVMIVAFAAWERRHAQPVLPARIMTWPLVAVYARAVAYYFGLYVLVLATPGWLVSTRGLSASTTAVVMVALPATTVTACLVTPVLVARIGVRQVLLLGSLALAGAAVILSQVDERSPLALLVLGVALLGVPAGLLNIGQQVTLVRATPAAYTGTCSGLYGLVQLMTGAAAAIAVAFGLRTAGLLTLALVIVLIVSTLADRGPQDIDVRPDTARPGVVARNDQSLACRS